MNIGNFSCPLPIMENDTIQLAHGSGGRLSAELIEKLFLPRFTNPILERLEDQAVLAAQTGAISFSTDSFVVDPIFFPGGDIGDLAINGTVNDVAMAGAIPRFLSCAFILEEGLPIEDLHRILLSMETAARKAGVQVVTGDTKVVNRGSCDRIFINTSGLGVIIEGSAVSAANLKAGDKLLISGTIADHGMAIMTSRHNLSLESRIISDTAALNGLVQRMTEISRGGIHALRDPTRGGVATSLNEFARTSKVGIKIDTSLIPIKAEVKGACEILGIDPLYVANEGKLLAALAPDRADDILAAVREEPPGREAAIIGEVVSEHPGLVTNITPLGTERIIDMPIGEQLPRIC